MTNKHFSSNLWLIIGVVGVGWVSSAQAFSSGIATTSFPVPAQGCNFCHSGGSAPSVTLQCADCGGTPLAVEPLSVHEFRFSVFEIGLQDHAGLNISSVLGTLSTGGVFATNTQAISGSGGRQEITHTAPKPESGAVIEFSFLWTAPASSTTATLQAWGNAVNFNGNTGGDAASVVTLDIIVGSTPTATATAVATATPTASATPIATCPTTADAGCTAFAKGFLLMKAYPAGRERLVAKLLRGPALQQTDMGNPLDVGQGGTGTAYALCVYDDASNLAGSIIVERAGEICDGKPCWRPIGNAPNDPDGAGKGYKYMDRSLASDGVLRVLYRGGDAGRSQAIVVGKGPALPVVLPAALQSSSSATVQLRSSDGLCLSVQLNEISKQEPFYFKAK